MPLRPSQCALRPAPPPWTLRDWIAAAALFAATAGVVLWQNAHRTVLWDLSYILDSAARIAAGQIPYRDFPFVHTPGTFLVQAAILRLTGHVYFHHVLYAALLSGLATVLAWRIALHTLRGRVAAAWTVALLVAAPLAVLGICCIVPLPEYDSDCAFWMLVSVWLLERVDENRQSAARGFAAGVFACVPMLFKQNMGLPYLAAVVASVVAVLAVQRLRRAPGSTGWGEGRALVWVLAGAGGTLLLVALVLQATAGIGNYLHWTVQFAGQRRMPGFGLMLSIYRDPLLVCTLPSVALALVALRSELGKHRRVHVAAFALLALPCIFTLASLFVYDNPDERGDRLLALWPLLLLLAAALSVMNLIRFRRQPCLHALLPVLLLAGVHGAFMSQQLWGSTYGIWPLLVLLAASLFVFLSESAARAAAARWFVPGLAALFSLTLLVCGGFYTASEERLSYVQFPDGPVAHSAFPQLRGMATPGPYLPEFDELLRYAQASIPFNDGLILLPGEEPFYFATGRTPRFPVLLSDPTTQPYSPAEIDDLARQKNIRWLVIKHDLQIKADPTPEREATLNALMPGFKLAARLRGYDIYRR
jgi:hypothetical protein